MKKIFILAIMIFIAATDIFAQEAILTQNSSLTQLAPSFAGITDKKRISLNYRNSNPLSVKTLNFEFDFYSKGLKSGIGFSIFENSEGFNSYNNFRFGIHYNYRISINENIICVPGISFSYQSHSNDFNKIIFGDQIGLDGTIKPQSIELPPMPRKGFLNAESSVLIYNTKMWSGVSVKNLLRPNESLYDWDSNSNISVLLTVFGGYKFVLSENVEDKPGRSFIFSYVYQLQNNNGLLDLKGYYSHSYFTFGLGARSGFGGIQNRINSAMVITGFQYKPFRMGYSFDLSLNNIVNFHEISLAYIFGN